MIEKVGEVDSSHRDGSDEFAARNIPGRDAGDETGVSRPMSTRESLMEPIAAAGHDDLHGLRLDLLRQAVGLYLDLAYPSGALPETARRRLDWREDCPASELLTGPPFKHTARPRGGRRRSMRCGWAITAIRT